MTREIKFRAWDKENEQMYSMPLNNYFGLSRFFGIVPSTAILMQYTGLKDAKGVEIWEGDILKWNNEVGEYKWTEDFACYEFQGNEKRYPQRIDEKDIEVIGNMWENPELLTK